MKKKLSCFLLALLVCLACTLPLASAAGGVPQKVLDARSSVFRVFCKYGADVYTGTAFVIASSPSGNPILATNYHVVNGMDDIQVATHDNQFLPASILAFREEHDLCLIQLSAPLPNAQPLPLLDAAQQATGTEIFTLGYPTSSDNLTDSYAYSLEEMTITTGIVSSIKSMTLDNCSSPVSLLQITAVISPGNSGGPLLDQDGHVLGVNTLTADSHYQINGSVAAGQLIRLADSQGISLSSQPAFPWLPVLLAAGGALLIAATILLLALHRRRARRAAQEQAAQGFVPPQTNEEALPTAPPASDPNLQSQREYAAAMSSQYNPAAQDASRGQVYPQQSQSSAHQQQNPPQPRVKKPRRRWSRKAKALTCVLAAVVLLLGAGAAVFLHNEARYQDALTFARQNSFPEASQHIQKVFVHYKDSDQLNQYIAAGLKLQNGDYAAARPAFQSMPGYLNSAQMLLECDYQQAAALLQDGQFEQARELFSSLADQNYADAEQQVLECDYRQAIDFMNHNQLKEARLLFYALAEQDYSDADQQILECDYRKARNCMNRNEFNDAIRIYSNLANLNYKDSRTLVNEAMYQGACYYSLSDDMFYFGRAYVLFTQLGRINYRDSQKRADALYRQDPSVDFWL